LALGVACHSHRPLVTASHSRYAAANE